MEKGGANREHSYTPDYREYVCHGVSVLAMGSTYDVGSCDEARLSGRTTDELTYGWSACVVSNRIRVGSCWKLRVPILLAVKIRHGT